jgi:hypothetical protein
MSEEFSSILIGGYLWETFTTVSSFAPFSFALTIVV